MGVMMNRDERRRAQKTQHAYVAAFPADLTPVPRDQWPQYKGINAPFEVWRSRNYLVQAFNEAAGTVRLSVCRTKLDGNRWQDGIAWEELQEIKADVGYADFDAVEVFPRQSDVVNVANMRHLWVMPDPVPFAWRKSQ
jgi:hypothetical protein